MLSSIPSLNIDNSLSLYIPVVQSEHANLEYFKNVFHSLNIGSVKRVEFKSGECGYTMRAFVHFNYWYNNICVSNLQERILNNDDEGRLVHDDPKYWILKKNNNPIPDNFIGQLEEIRNQNIKNYTYLLEYIQTLHTTINEQAYIINKLDWSNRLHERNLAYLYQEINSINEEISKVICEENNSQNTSRVRKRTFVDYSEC